MLFLKTLFYKQYKIGDSFLNDKDLQIFYYKKTFFIIKNKKSDLYFEFNFKIIKEDDSVQIKVYKDLYSKEIYKSILKFNKKDHLYLINMPNLIFMFAKSRINKLLTLENFFVIKDKIESISLNMFDFEIDNYNHLLKIKPIKFHLSIDPTTDIEEYAKSQRKSESFYVYEDNVYQNYIIKNKILQKISIGQWNNIFNFYITCKDNEQEFLLSLSNKIYHFKNEKEFLDFSIFKLLENKNLNDKFKKILIQLNIMTENEEISQKQIDLYNIISY